MYLYRLVVFIAVVFCLSGCSKDDSTAKTKAPVPEDTRDSVVISYSGADSMSVLALLEANHEVDVVKSAMGAFVRSIDSIENGNRVFWFYSVNNEMGNIAADNYLTNDEDTVRWHFRFIGPENQETDTAESSDSTAAGSDN